VRHNRCKHYSGNVYCRGPCDAGVNVRERVGGPDDGWLMRSPCFPEHAEKAFACKDFALPTKEELEAEKREQRASLERIARARAAILEAGAKPRSAGQLPCPVCERGTLSWSMASNGHVHARCTTAGCVSWME
jgi:hypothetical protein